MVAMFVFVVVLLEKSKFQLFLRGIFTRRSFLFGTQLRLSCQGETPQAAGASWTPSTNLQTDPGEGCCLPPYHNITVGNAAEAARSRS